MDDNGGPRGDDHFAHLCKNCQYFAATLSRLSALRPQEGVGECRRNAPRGPAVLGWSAPGEPEHNHTAIMSPFHFTSTEDWCGQFQPHYHRAPKTEPDHGC